MNADSDTTPATVPPGIVAEMAALRASVLAEIDRPLTETDPEPVP